MPANTGCACPGSVLTFTCMITGSGSTIWEGTAFNCDGNDILLRHDRFTDSGGVSDICNDGNIVGRSTGVENNNCYTSELNVMVSPSLNNKTVVCTHSSFSLINIGVSVLTVQTMEG